MKKFLKRILNCCKRKIVLKIRRLHDSFCFKDPMLKDLTSGVVYKFQCSFCNDSCYAECVGNLNARIGEHIGISLITKQPRKIPVGIHLLFWNQSISYDNFRIPSRPKKMFLLQPWTKYCRQIKQVMYHNIFYGILCGWFFVIF